MSVVYFLECSETARIKIGATDDLTTRIAAINSANCAPARLIAVVTGGKDVEAYLHRRFAEDRVNGEWFRASQDMAEVVRSACLGRFPYREVSASRRQDRDGYCEALETARRRLMIIGSGSNDAGVSARRSYAAAKTGLSPSRVFDLWYSKARAISPVECARIDAALDDHFGLTNSPFPTTP